MAVVLVQEILAVLAETPKKLSALQRELGVDVRDESLNRGLQKLRKDGKVRWTTKGWVRAETRPCPTCKGKGWVKP